MTKENIKQSTYTRRYGKMMKRREIANNQERVDIFEDLRSRVGCAHISDLRYMPHITMAKRVIRKFRFEDYSLKQLNDMAHYLYGEKVFFDYHQQAESFFRSRMESRGALRKKLLFGKI